MRKTKNSGGIRKVSCGLVTAMILVSLAGCNSSETAMTPGTMVDEKDMASATISVVEEESIEQTETDVETVGNSEEESQKEKSLEEMREIIIKKTYEQAGKVLNTESNDNFSAFSLYYSLGMLGAGADGTTKEALDKFLGVDVAENINTMASMMKEFNREESPFSIANAEFVDNTVELKEDYVKLIKDDLGAEIRNIDFKDEKTANEEINVWINEKTHGMIKEGSGVTADDVMDIVNAVYFKDAWNYFKEDYTTRYDFTLRDGSMVQVDMMSARRLKPDRATYDEGEGFRRLTLYMDNSKFIIVLPEDGATLDDLLVNPEGTFHSTSYNNSNYVVNVRLPKFKFETKRDLNSYLQESGLSEVFGDGADFSKLGTSEDKPLKVGSVSQKTAIEVNESGVEAAAVTEIAMKTMAARVEPDEEEIIDFDVDREALFSIETNDGIPMFIGVLSNPNS